MFRNIFITIAFLFSIGIFAQNIKQINADLKLSDSLTHKREIRIYQNQGITNYSSVFRIYFELGKCKAEFYEHFAKTTPSGKSKVIKKELVSKKDNEFVFANIIGSHVLDLPNQEKIQWKLSARKDMVKQIDTSRRGKITKFYYVPISSMLTVDGESFYVQARHHTQLNDFSYGNPDTYLNKYPEVDELQFMCEILVILRTEFNIWKKED
ncbi:hypothetical protein [Nonlabens sp.]|uniref:hypothetical protein n=1 Tax=Nonlabens sp. TaxID=1888209 RepID=UPI0032662F36